MNKKIRKLLLPITLSILIIIQAIILFVPEAEDELVNNQKFIVEVSHDGKTYSYYCQDYIRDRITGGNTLILLDYKGTPSYEIIVTETMFVRSKSNPHYYPQFFEKLKETKTEPKEIKKFV